MITLKRTNSNDSDFSLLTMQLDNELKTIYGATQEEFDQYNEIADLQTVVIAYENNKPVGCGCFKQFDADSVEIKRMFVEPGQRGKGIGAFILNELENWAAETGYHSTVLETGTAQPAAVQLYKKLGYQIIPNYHPYIGNALSMCMKKLLAKNLQERL